MADYQIRSASFSDINLMLEWAADETWNPGLYDALSFQLIDAQGFYMGYLDNEPIASISAVNYDNHFAFVGLFIVRQEYRGLRYGAKIWEAALEKISHVRTIGLDGVVAQQARYRELGFEFAFANMRFCLSNYLPQKIHSSFLISAADLPLQIIDEYDRRHFPSSRRAFLTSWLFASNATSLVYFDGEIRGLGVIRQCREGYKIGPLFAENSDIARIILLGLCNTVMPSNQKIYLDVPLINDEAKKLAESLHMKPVFETGRMYRGQKPNLPMAEIFGLTTYEMG